MKKLCIYVGNAHVKRLGYCETVIGMKKEGNLLFLLSKSRIKKKVHNIHRNMSGTGTHKPQYNKAVTTPIDVQTPFQVRVTKTCTFFNTHLVLFFQMNRVKLLFHIWSWQNANTLTRSPNKGLAICLCVCPYCLLHVWANASQLSVITKQKLFCKD